MKRDVHAIVDRGRQAAAPTPQAMAHRYKPLGIDAAVAELRANCLDGKLGRFHSATEAVMALGPDVVGPLLRAAKREPRMYAAAGRLLQEMINHRPGQVLAQHVPAFINGLEFARSRQDQQSCCDYSYLTYIALREDRRQDVRGIVPMLVENLNASRGDSRKWLAYALSSAITNHPEYPWQSVLPALAGSLYGKTVAMGASALREIAVAHPEYPEWANVFGDIMRAWARLETRGELATGLMTAKDDLQDALDTLREHNEGCRRIDVKKLFEKPL